MVITRQLNNSVQPYIFQSNNCLSFYFEEMRFGDIIRGEVAAKTEELLAIEESSIDVVIPAIVELRSRLKQTSLLWEIYPHHLLWYCVFFAELVY